MCKCKSFPEHLFVPDDVPAIEELRRQREELKALEEERQDGCRSWV